MAGFRGLGSVGRFWRREVGGVWGLKRVVEALWEIWRRGVKVGRGSRGGGRGVM